VTELLATDRRAAVWWVSQECDREVRGTVDEPKNPTAVSDAADEQFSSTHQLHSLIPQHVLATSSIPGKCSTSGKTRFAAFNPVWSQPWIAAEIEFKPMVRYSVAGWFHRSSTSPTSALSSLAVKILSRTVDCMQSLHLSPCA
jgi:hypothetical protein